MLRRSFTALRPVGFARFSSGSALKFTSFLFAILAFSVVACTPQKQALDVKGAWVRATVQGQNATGAFMTITSRDAAKLVGVTSAVAGVVEVHEMKMDGDVMTMRAVEGGLDLPAGQAVELKPGGFHLMMMDLKQTLAKDTTIAMTLTFKDSKGKESTLEVNAVVSTVNP